MANQREKIALGVALAAGIGGYIYTQTRGADGEGTKKTGENNFPASEMKSGVEPMDNASMDDSKEAPKDVTTEMDDPKIRNRKEEDDSLSKMKTGTDEGKKDSNDKKVEPVAKI